MSEQQPQVVVVTGSSGGVGRAIAHAFAKRGAHIGLLARGERGPGRGRRARSRRSAARRSRSRPTSPTTSRSRRPPSRSRSGSGRSTSGSTTRWRRCSRAFVDIEPEEFKRATEVTYLGAVYGTMAALQRMSRARPRHDRPGRLGAVLPGDPAAGRLLRREVRDPRLHRLDPHRAAARQEQRADHDGPAARRQHDPVQLVSLQAARPPAAGAADLPAGDPGRGGLLGRPPPPPRAVGRLQRRPGDPRQPARARASPTGIWPGPASTASRCRTCRSAPTGPTTCSSRCRAWPRRTASSTTRPRPAARSCGRPPTARSWPARWPAVARRGAGVAARLAR